MSDNNGAAHRVGPPHGMLSDAPPNPTTPAVDALIGMLRRGDRDAAGRLLDSAQPPFAAEQIGSLADGLMRRRRWAEAAWLYGWLPTLDAASGIKRCLCGNLAALELRRPALYKQLIALPATNAFSVESSASGRPTLMARRSDGTLVSLAAGPEPLTAAAALLAQLKQATPGGEPVGLCGLGDGYVLAALARHPPKLFMNMEQAVFVLEPEPQVLLHALMIHDYTRETGPITAERVRWFVGADWASQLAVATQAQPGMGLPAVTLKQGPDGASIHQQLSPLFVAVAEHEAAAKRVVDEHYATFSPGRLAGLFGPNPPRRPRVLLLTTRFSTVLQYSTRDTANALEQSGWEARVVIEPAPSQRIHRHAIRGVVAEFQPDLVFQIDHLRHEHGDLFPPQLPFVCWAQDHLANLTNARAGASVGLRDFVLVGMPTMYVNRYGYPRRQTLMLAKLTRVPERPASWDSDGDDLVYVSTASARPADVATAIVAHFAGGPADVRQLAETCCRRTIEHYAAGNTLPAINDYRELVTSIESETGATIEDEATRRRLADMLFDRLGNVLYRQQALAWAVGIAQRHGLTLALYGAGWDAHPEFAPFARGPVAYGPALEELTRRSKINFALEPGFSVSHQRLVDGLVSGGFFLARHHPKNTAIQAISNFLARHVPPSVTIEAEARQLLAPDNRETFDGLAGRLRPLVEFADAVEVVRTCECAGLVRPGDAEPLPGLAAISFADEASLEACVLRFVNDPALRADIAARQRETMGARRSYVAGIGRIVSEIRALLLEEAGSDAAVEDAQPMAAAA